MSSQGPASSSGVTNGGYPAGSANPGTVTPRGYRYSLESIRDASDYTEYIRQQKIYSSYVGAAAPQDNRPDIYGSWFRLQYLLGRHKRGVCTGTGGACVGGIAKQIDGEIGDS
jgi:hypothetical protein